MADDGGMMETSGQATKRSEPRMNSRASEATFDSESEALSLEENTSSRASRRFRLLLDGGAFALFAIFLLRLLPLLIEFNPLNSSWQSELVTTLVNQGLLAFLGFAFLHLAVFLQPRHDLLRQRLRLVRRLAVIPVVGYLLLAPLQLASSFGDLSTARSQKAQFLERSARLSEIREAVQRASSSQDLNVRLQSLLEPGLTGDQWKMSLPELRKSLLKTNELKQEEVTRLVKANSDNIQSLPLVISRVGSALAWAFAFASGAVPWGHRSTLVERMRRR
ncbi:MAG: hypothetical protein VKM17_08030 [Cyanobacteriota bacterium]|nr:hypothetical protein [Cyanobacteriota bacterium]